MPLITANDQQAPELPTTQFIDFFMNWVKILQNNLLIASVQFGKGDHLSGFSIINNYLSLNFSSVLSFKSITQQIGGKFNILYLCYYIMYNVYRYTLAPPVIMYFPLWSNTAADTCSSLGPSFRRNSSPLSRQRTIGQEFGAVIR